MALDLFVGQLVGLDRISELVDFACDACLGPSLQLREGSESVCDAALLLVKFRIDWKYEFGRSVGTLNSFRKDGDSVDMRWSGGPTS